MVSSNTSEERADRGYKTRENGERREYKSKDNFKRDFKSDNTRFERKKDYNSNDGERKNNRFNKNDNLGKKDNNHGGEFKKNFSNSNRGGASRDFSRGNSDRMSAASADTKVKEQQPDKMDIVKRLEKEKKAIQKKNDNYNKGGKSPNARPQKKVKRTNNIDWTREYENDSYDDDVYFMY